MLLNNAAFEIPGCLRVVKKRVSVAGMRKLVVAGDHEKPISREDPSEVSPMFQGEVVSGGLKISDRIVDPVKEVLPSSDGDHIPVESPLQGLKKRNNKNGITHQDQGHKASKAPTSVFKAPAFYVCMLATMVGEYSLVSFGTTIVDFAVGKGIPLNVAMNLITCASVGHLFGRLVIMPLSDLAPCSRWFLYSGSHVLEALCTLLIPRVGSAWGIIALRLAEAISQGSSAAIRAILVAQLLGVEAVAFCTGAFGVVMVPIWLTSPQIMGFFRDGMGSYDGFYGMLGAVNTAAAVVTGVFFACNWKRLQQKRRCDYVATEQDVSASAA
ncbi:hypothetical protein HPB48_012196 [Haemaphysalis longicornis]|uniref:Monocarboxylate transporter n=1 Tax=Haemaphysalis longicornis TaxID=44386 RepID=A0A9J6GQC8_HAELO|nr:hypothetical protein HPB48_012196 [Haemaphysalis longicornis]